MAGIIKRTVGPVALSATLTTNVYNNTSALIYDVIKHVHVANKTGAAASFTFYVGGTGANSAGTEWFFAQSVPANGVYDWYGNLKLINTDFVVGGASAGTTLTLIMEGEQYVV